MFVTEAAYLSRRGLRKLLSYRARRVLYDPRCSAVLEAVEVLLRGVAPSSAAAAYLGPPLRPSQTQRLQAFLEPAKRAKVRGGATSA
jgi:hypothetical protein